MSRLQLALNVGNIDEAVEFYRRLFGAEPAKRRPGYANFAIADPPLKLVLFENPSAAGSLNHLGVEVGSSGEVATEAVRLRGQGFELVHEDGVTCCHALQDKFWVPGTDARPWEIYTVLADAPQVEQSTGCGTGGCATATAASVESR